MKLLVIHQHYLLPGQPGGSRFNEFARMWTEAGHEVSVIAGGINYTTGQVPEQYAGRWITKEVQDGVTVYRCYVPRSYRDSYAGRIWAFFVFTLSSLHAVAKAKRPDAVIATSPPLTTALTGGFAALWHRVPWVFEVRDLWPESVIAMGGAKRGSLFARLLFAMEKWAYRSATVVNVLTPAFKDDIVGRKLIPAEKIVVIPNGADEAFEPGTRENDARRELGWGDRTVAMYAGAHGRANALNQLIETAALLRDRPDILIACVGDGPERQQLSERAASMGLDNIRFHGPFAKERMPEIVRAADMGVAVLANTPLFRTVYPNKVFDYMSCERPTLLGIDGVARKLVVDDAQAGVFAEPENARALADGILRLADDPELRARMGSNGRTWVLANQTRVALATRYLEVLMKIIR